MAEDLDKIEKLIAFMEEHGLSELKIKQGDLEFKARRGGLEGGGQQAPFVFQPVQGLITEPPRQAGVAGSGTYPSVAPEPVVEPVEDARNLKEICSPIVGTFYRRPNPTSPPYKELGDYVDKGDVVAIVEAMKVMNEIKSEVSGTIKKILVEDATPVEFGQPLMLVAVN